jgi:hypothetical protein
MVASATPATIMNGSYRFRLPFSLGSKARAGHAVGHGHARGNAGGRYRHDIADRVVPPQAPAARVKYVGMGGDLGAG